MKRKLFEAIKAKVAGRKCDEKFIRDELVKIMFYAYQSRYGKLISMPDPMLHMSERISQSSSELSRSTLHDDNERLMDGTLIVTWVTFLDSCLGWLTGAREEQEGKKKQAPLLRQIADLDFANDTPLTVYLKNCFSNHLQKMIDDLTPGVETRKKQIGRVLKKMCTTCTLTELQTKHHTCRLIGKTAAVFDRPAKRKRTKEPRRICILKDCVTDRIDYQSVPGHNALKGYVNGIWIPELHYPKKVDSDRGPSVKDDDMQMFVKTILDRAGGAAYYDDLLSVIIETLNPPIAVNSDTVRGVSEYGKETSIFNMLTKSPGEVSLCNEHFEKAEQIWRSMPIDLKTIFRKRFGDDQKQGKDIANDLKVSAGTIANRITAMEKYFHDQLRNPGEGYDYDEGLVIVNIVTIISMRDDQ